MENICKQTLRILKNIVYLQRLSKSVRQFWSSNTDKQTANAELKSREVKNNFLCNKRGNGWEESQDI